MINGKMQKHEQKPKWRVARSQDTTQRQQVQQLGQQRLNLEWL